MIENDQAVKIARGHEAETILSNPLVRDILGQLEDQYIQAWKAAKTVEAREDAHRFTVVIEQLRADLRSLATTGALTKQRLDNLG